MAARRRKPTPFCRTLAASGSDAARATAASADDVNGRAATTGSDLLTFTPPVV